MLANLPKEIYRRGKGGFCLPSMISGTARCDTIDKESHSPDPFLLSRVPYPSSHCQWLLWESGCVCVWRVGEESLRESPNPGTNSFDSQARVGRGRRAQEALGLVLGLDLRSAALHEHTSPPAEDSGKTGAACSSSSKDLQGDAGVSLDVPAR